MIGSPIDSITLFGILMTQTRPVIQPIKQVMVYPIATTTLPPQVVILIAVTSNNRLSLVTINKGSRGKKNSLVVV